MSAAPGQPVKYRVQMKKREDDQVTINMTPVPHGMSFADGGRVTSVPAGSQAAIIGVKPDWIIASIAGRRVEGESKETINSAFMDARNSGASYPVLFATPKVLAIRAENLVRAS